MIYQTRRSRRIFFLRQQRYDRINHLLNVHYADEFCEDLELFSMWFDLHMQAKKSKDLQENWVDAQESSEAAVEEDWVDSQE